MKVLMENNKEGLLALIGKRVTFFTMNYIYTGRLIDVNTRDVKLEDASIVYETGELCSKEWKDAQRLPNDFYIRLNSVEAYWEFNK